MVQDCLRLPIVATVETAESRYRHPRHHLPGMVEVLRRVFANPMPLMAGAAAAGDLSEPADPTSVTLAAAVAATSRVRSGALTALLNEHKSP